MTIRRVSHSFSLKRYLRGVIAHRNNSLLACFGVCLVLLVANGCAFSQQRRVNEAAEEVYKNLYVPADAILLGKVESDDRLIYARGCKGVLIESAYGVNRPLAEILQEYQQALLKSGWEFRPEYEQENFALYQNGPMEEIHILSRV